MTESMAVLQGQVLRAWREESGVSAAALARMLRTSRSAVSMWENGREERRPSPAQVEGIGRALGLDRAAHQALRDMWRGIGSVVAFPSRSEWAHNYQPPSEPAWTWLRSAPDVPGQRPTLQWGPFIKPVPEPLRPGGLVVQAPTSVPNPPLHVFFDRPGWAIFGRGEVPPGVASRLDAGHLTVDMVTDVEAPFVAPLSADGSDESWLREWISRGGKLANSMKVQFKLLRPHLGVLRAGRATHQLATAAVAATTWPDGSLTDDLGVVVSYLLDSPETVQRRRAAFGLSREAAAAEVNRLQPGDEITARTLEMLESGVRVPERAYLLARLDTVLQVDGHLGVERVFDSRSTTAAGKRPHAVRFPAFWQGPIWLQPRHSTDPEATGLVTLKWGAWSRRQEVRSGSTLTTRKAIKEGPDLEIEIPAGWDVTAGVGALPGALDINHGWYLASISEGRALIMENLMNIARGRGPGRG